MGFPVLKPEPRTVEVGEGFVHGQRRTSLRQKVSKEIETEEPENSIVLLKEQNAKLI